MRDEKGRFIKKHTVLSEWRKSWSIKNKNQKNRNIEGLKLGPGWNKGLKRWWDSPSEFKKGQNKGYTPWNKNKTCPQISQSLKGKLAWNKGLKGFLGGEKSPHWKGGITSINMKIRNSLEYKIWRDRIFTRDDFTCQICGERGNRLNADHIRPFSLYPTLRFEESNGRTLCVECHKGTDTWGVKSWLHQA